MKRKIIFLACIIFLNISLNAQKTIVGTIIDKDNGYTIEGAYVELINPEDSLCVTGSITSENGFFKIVRNDTVSKFVLRIKHLSYDEKNLPLESKEEIILGHIFLKPKVNLIGEVVVSATKTGVTDLSDRTIYGISSDFKKTSTDAMDVLRKIPGVQIDFVNEDIQVDGYNNIRLEINGRERNKAFLKRLSPTQVDKIEVITAPSGKYGGEVEAVINIITSKEYDYGIKGNVLLSIPNSSLVVGNNAFGVDFNFKKLFSYISSDLNYNILDFIYEFKRNSISNDELVKNGDIKRVITNGGVNLGFQYEPTLKDVVDFDIRINPYLLKYNYDLTNFSSENNVLEKYFKSDLNSKNTNTGINSSINYKHVFNKENNHNMNVEINTYSSINKQSYENNELYFSPVDFSHLISEKFQSEKNNVDRVSFNPKLEYFLPVTEKISIGTGVSYYYQKFESKSMYSNGQIAEPFIYTENRSALFIDVNKQFRKLAVKVGISVENTNMVINNMFKNGYFNFLPNISGIYRINSNRNIRISYIKRLTRPISDDLNPYINNIDSFNIKRGNYNLNPSTMNRVQISYSFKINKTNISPMIHYEKGVGLIQQISSIIPQSNITITYPDNISNNQEYGISLSIAGKISIISINSYINYYELKYGSYENQIIEQRDNGVKFNTNLNVQFTKNIFLNIYVTYSSPRLSGQRISSRSVDYFITPGVRFKNNSTLTMVMSNPIFGIFTNSKYVTNSQNFTQTEARYIHTAPFMNIRYTYYFNIGKSIKKTKRDVQIDNEGGKKAE